MNRIVVNAPVRIKASDQGTLIRNAQRFVAFARLAGKSYV
jgi:hypothetical protein